LQTQQTRQDKKIQHLSRVVSCSTWSQNTLWTTFNPLFLYHMGRALGVSITRLQLITCVRLTWRRAIWTISSKYFLSSRSDYSQSNFSSLLRERVETGEIKVRAAHWPAFMYSFVNGYDPDDKQNGLCRGLLLVRVRSSFLVDHII